MIKENNWLSFEELLKRQLKDQEVRLMYEEKRFYLQIGRLVYELRLKNGLSQEQLAQKAKVSQPLIARLEKGDKNRIPTFETIYKILKVLGYHLEILAVPDLKKAA